MNLSKALDSMAEQIGSLGEQAAALTRRMDARNAARGDAISDEGRRQIDAYLKSIEGKGVPESTKQAALQALIKHYSAPARGDATVNYEGYEITGPVDHKQGGPYWRVFRKFTHIYDAKSLQEAKDVIDQRNKKDYGQ